MTGPGTETEVAWHVRLMADAGLAVPREKKRSKKEKEKTD